MHPIPPMLTEIVSTAIQVCDGTTYIVQGPCPSCGGNLAGYDTRKKRFAVLYDDQEEKPVEVLLKRAYCVSCGKIIMPEGPFYPGTRVGSPIVDLCRAFAGTLSPGRVAARLGQIGIFVDRWSVREYITGDFPQVTNIAAFGMMIPITIISLSSLAGSLQDNGSPDGQDILSVCNYPARYGMKK